MAVINQSIGGGGANINGIIEQYRVAAGENISAGDFVQFIHEFGNSTQLYSKYTTGTSFIRAALLDQNRVLVCHNGGVSTVIKLNGTNITKGADYTNISFGDTFEVLTTANDTVLIVYIDVDGYMQGVVVKINDTVVTPGTPTFLSGSSYSDNKHISICPIGTNRVFVFHTGEGNTFPYGMIITINDSAITPGTATILSTVDYSGWYLSASTINSEKVFVIYGWTEINAQVISVSGMTITAGVETNFRNSSTDAPVGLTPLNENKIFIMYHQYSDGVELSCLIANINGATITFEDSKSVSIEIDRYCGEHFGAFKLENNKIFVWFTSGSQEYYGYPYGLIVVVEDENIILKAPVQLSTMFGMFKSMYAIKAGTNGAFITSSGNTGIEPTYVYGIMDTIAAKQATPSTIDGIAKTSGTQSEVIGVYVPE